MPHTSRITVRLRRNQRWMTLAHIHKSEGIDEEEKYSSEQEAEVEVGQTISEEPAFIE